jgi:hypothetical protein
MTPDEIQRALDYDLFIARDKRTVFLLSVVVSFCDDSQWWTLPQHVRDAVNELKELSEAWEVKDE